MLWNKVRYLNILYLLERTVNVIVDLKPPLYLSNQPAKITKLSSCYFFGINLYYIFPSLVNILLIVHFLTFIEHYLLFLNL